MTNFHFKTVFIQSFSNFVGLLTISSNLRKIFSIDLKDATNIQNIPSLQTTKPFKPAVKKLLLNMDDLGMYTDNIEGMTFGPDLPNGHKTLVFVADNNFNLFEKTQFLLFEVIP